MMVMPAQRSASIIHYWAGRYPGRIGWIVGPESTPPRTKLVPWIPFALDNGAFPAWQKNQPWNPDAWFSLLDAVKRSHLNPIWCIVPDVVADRLATIQRWKEYSPLLRRFGWPLAFAVQDGMTPSDVPTGTDVVFVGGTDSWKFRCLPTWCSHFPRVHVGRVNGLAKLLICERLGVESVDGSGWFRGTDHGREGRQLQAWIEGHATNHPELFGESS